MMQTFERIVEGPYWVRTATNGRHQVCGRHGATIREYPADQLSLAGADCRKLQLNYVKAEKRLADAAPELLEALRGAIGALEFSRDYHSDLSNEEQAFAQDKLDAAVKAIAKAEGR